MSENIFQRIEDVATKAEEAVITTEHFVVGVVAKFHAGEVVAEHEAAAAIKWIAGEIPGAVGILGQGITLIEGLGLSTNPDVALAITAANVMVAGLNKFETAYQAGATDAATVASGYSALKQSAAAVANAVAAAAAIPAAKA